MDIEDPAALRRYLDAEGHAGPGGIRAIETLAGGVSCRTVRVRFADGRAWVLKQALATLRVQAEWHCPPERIHTEAAGMRWFAAAAPAGAIPVLVFEDRVHHVIGMEAVTEPHVNWKAQLLAEGPDAAIVAQFGDLLARLHDHGVRHAAEGAARFGEYGFFRALRLEAYYAYTGRQVPALAGFLDGVIADCEAHRYTVAHGDYSPKNVLVRAGRIVLLDHEVAHWGDGAFDVGFGLTHLLSKAHHLPARRAAFAAAARLFWQRYAAGVAADAALARRCAAHGVGCLAARAAGRSPLEYLDAAARARQLRVVQALVRRAPADPAELAERFVEELAREGA